MMLDSFAPPNALDPDLDRVISGIRADLRDEYLENHDFPWIVGFSGGKDSTLVAHLVFEMLLSLAPDDRRRPVHIVSNDTLVESPLVVAHIAAVQAEMEAAARAWRLPIFVVTTRPDPDATFWVNLIGRGYPSPNRSFRWCTDRMKIQPTSRYIREQVAASGEVILLLGVRRDESATRAGSIARYDNGTRLNDHNDLKGCKVFRPIVDLIVDDVWEFLGTVSPPWGGTHRALIQLYRDAGGGECPVVTSQDDAPSCGTTSSRFGCWTCTVVEKDRSLLGFVDAGFAEFAPLIGFRDWLASIRNDPNRRMARRRDGRFLVTKEGVFVPGPFTFETRREILERVLALQAGAGQTLINEDEVARIRRIWADDAAQAAAWEAEARPSS
ncbi:MAG: DNA phosphorothioation system sulfurtransferase DndC [Brevundimonas sp.]|nr:DNA phosphorothioation system sulfurtransferase DndC [Brevundimonas sp.]